MTNEQKYKTAEERAKAFKKFCDNMKCSQCPHNLVSRLVCPMYWLSDEYKEPKPKPDLPFYIDKDEYGWYLIRIAGQNNIVNGFLLKENSKALCDQLNAAARAWHKRMKKEKK